MLPSAICAQTYAYRLQSRQVQYVSVPMRIAGSTLARVTLEQHEITSLNQCTEDHEHVRRTSWPRGALFSHHVAPHTPRLASPRRTCTSTLWRRRYGTALWRAPLRSSRLA